MPYRYTVIEAPSILGLKPTGVEGLASQMLRYGFAERLHARHAGRVDALPYSPDRDPLTQTLNAQAIAAWTPRLAAAVEAVLDRGEFPVILGGDCSILLGPALALKRRGRFGLFFIDGHADFYQPEVNPNGEAASMELAFATGHGPPLVCDIEGRAPLFRSEDVVAFGYRDGEEQRSYGSQPLPDDLLDFNLAAIRDVGVASAAGSAVEHVTRSPLDGFFIHVDADVVHDDLMPAVDYRIPDGLTWEELAVSLRTALASERAVGLELTIYNPSLDHDGSAGRELTNVLVAALQSGVGSP